MLGLFLACATLARAQANKPLPNFAGVGQGAVNTLDVGGGVLYVGGTFTQAYTASGSFAVVNETSGAALPPFPQVSGNVNDIIPDGAGGWYLGGNFTSVGGLPRIGLAHILADGRISDWSPAVSGGAATVFALMRAGHALYVGGAFSQVAGLPRNNLAAVHAATGVVLPWNPGTDGTVDDLELAGSWLYASGDFTTAGGQPRGRVAAFDLLSGVLDPLWNPDANARTRAVHANGGTLYLGGEFTSINVGTTAVARARVAAVEAPGTGSGTGADLGLAAPVNNGIVSSLVSDGATLYVCGSFTSAGAPASTRNRAAAFTAGGGTLLPWHPNVTGPSSPTVWLLALHGGGVYLAGNFDGVAGSTRRGLAAVTAGTSATLLPWNPSVAQVTPGIPALALAFDAARVAVGGAFAGIGAQQRSRLAAFDVATGGLLPWNPNANATVDALRYSNGTIYVGGVFTQIGTPAVGRNRAAALDTVGNVEPWNPDLNGAVASIETTTPGGPIYLGGSFTTVGATARPRLARVNAAGGLTGWNPTQPPNGTVLALALDGNTLYTGGQFTLAGSTVRNYLAAYDATSAALDPLWDPNVQPGGSSVNDIEVHLGGGPVFVGGNFASVQGQPRNYLAQLNPIGGTGAPTTFDPRPNTTVNGLAVLPSSFLTVGGNFTSVNLSGTPVSRTRLAAFDPGLAINNATPWNPTADAAVNTVRADTKRLYTGGSFTTVAGQRRTGLAVFCLAPPAQTLAAAPNGNNRITLTWSGSAPEYVVERGLDPGGPWEEVATVLVPTYSDVAVQGGATYYYTVRGQDECRSDPTPPVSATATGACGGPPVFEGLNSTAAFGSGVCGASLAWRAARAFCSGGVQYSVYRDTAPDFTPNISNRIATGLSDIKYVDTAGLLPSNTYYYIVRAAHNLGGAEEGNQIRFPFTPQGCTSAGPSGIATLTVRSGDTSNGLNWVRPMSLTLTHVRVCGPTSTCAGTYPANATDGDPVTVDSGAAGSTAFFLHSGLTNGATYNYAAFVESDGLFSGGRPSWGRPASEAGPAKWAFTTAASNLTPLAIAPGLAYIAVSNDRQVHSMRAGSGGGTWPPAWQPLTLDAPSQARPTIVNLSVPPASRVAFVSAQSGRVHAVDADTGAQLWVSGVLGASIVGSPSVALTAFGAASNLVLVGTREVTGASRLTALDPATGGVVWSFDNGVIVDMANAMGIISGQPAVDQAASRVYFTTRRRAGGSQDTVWCVRFSGGVPVKEWARDVGDVDAAPALGGNRLYVGDNTGRVYAFDKASGAFSWTPNSWNSGTGQPIKGFVHTVLISGAAWRLFFSSGDRVFAIDDNGGSTPVPFWPAAGIAVPGASTPLKTGLRAYVGGNDSRVYSIDAGTPTPAAPVSVLLGDPGTPKVVGRPTFDTATQLLLVGTDQGVAYSLAPFP